MSRRADAEAVRAAAHGVESFDPLIDRIGDAGCVLLGESTHGTAEFYAARAHITQRLVEEHGFGAVAVEADWPDAYRAGAWASGASDDPDAAAALGDFTRFPRWMWRNREVVLFLTWLRAHNDATAQRDAVGFYGLDLYSLHASIDKVVDYLDRVDPAASARARERYGCFDHYGQDAGEYGRAAAFGAGPSCEAAVVEQLVELQRRAGQSRPAAGNDAHFFAEQNARLVRNAERYHRAMFRVGPEAWNLRDRHMAETLDALREHRRGADGKPARVVVWAHNSHVGDARATELAEFGQLTLGQLAREAYGPDDAVLVGFSTFGGTVTAASAWGEPATVMRVGPASEDTTEALLHETGLSHLLLVMGEDARATAALAPTRLQRAIGVTYRPQTERISHHVFADVTRQLDVLVHLDTTTALEPLDGYPGWQLEDVAPTYPSGI